MVEVDSITGQRIVMYMAARQAAELIGAYVVQDLTKGARIRDDVDKNALNQLLADMDFVAERFPVSLPKVGLDWVLERKVKAWKRLRTASAQYYSNGQLLPVINLIGRWLHVWVLLTRISFRVRTGRRVMASFQMTAPINRFIFQ